MVSFEFRDLVKIGEIWELPSDPISLTAGMVQAFAQLLATFELRKAGERTVECCSTLTVKLDQGKSAA